MNAAEPLYSAAVDPEFEALVDDPTDAAERVSVSPVRHRGNTAENAKAAQLFG